MYFKMFPGLFQAFSRIQNEIGDFILVFYDLGHPKDVSQAISRPTLVRQRPIVPPNIVGGPEGLSQALNSCRPSIQGLTEVPGHVSGLGMA